VRPYIGDVLVVILIYCAVRSVLDSPVRGTALAVLAFSFAVEGLQYIHFIDLLGLQDSRIAATIIGNSFSWMDLVAYIAGIVLVLIAEKLRGGSKIN
jgi:hypothetical protein